MNYIVLPIFLVAASNIWGQAGAGFTALGGNTANPDAAFSLANNPAYFEKNKFLTGLWGHNRFAGTSLVNGGFAFHARHAGTAFGWSVNHTGTSLFQRNEVRLNAGQKINETFAFGFSIGYSALTQAYGYSAVKGRVTGKLATHFSFGKKMDAALVLCNPWNADDPWQLASPRADIAFGCQLGKATKCYAQFRQETLMPAVFGIALVHHFQEQFTFRAALQNGYEPISMGISWTQKNFQLGFASAYHTYLGFSPSFTLQWQKS